MARTAEPVDITPGQKSKDGEISSIKGNELATPIKYTAEWVVPSIDELVSLLADSEKRDSILTEIATYRRDLAVSTARSKALVGNEPPEVKIEKFVANALKMGMDADKAREFARAQFGVTA